jgi:uncharacterized membrane protein YbhN (UPF0104 family)
VTRRLVSVLTSFPFRAATTIVLLGALVVFINWGEFIDRLQQGDWRLFALGVLVVDAALLVGALRWHLFLRAGDVRTTIPQTLRAYWIGMFANNFLPTGFGGDAARALLVSRAAPSTGRAVSTVIVDRLTALICLVLVAWLVLAISPSDVPSSLVAVLAAATAVGILTAATLVLVARRGKFTRVVAQLWGAVGGRERAGGVLLVTTPLGLLYQGAMVLAAWIIARSINLDLSFALLAVVTPLVIVVTLFPISIAGFGVREGGYVALLAEAGVSAHDATLLSLLNVAALAIATLPGAFALLLSGGPRRVVAQEGLEREAGAALERDRLEVDKRLQA